MFARILLDPRNGSFYTNLDYVSGRVILNLPSDQTISAVNVKLEGEARTKLASPRDPNDRRERPRWELEVHKVLYKVQTVFPSQDLLQHSGSNAQYTLPAGAHEYPFRFKLPFNNDCKNTTNNVLRDLKFGVLSVQAGPDNTKHVKRALPPSLGGFPGEADISYFVKVTVVRPKFYQENFRVQEMIKFMPIEPPRPREGHHERFARRQHQFQIHHDLPKKTLFRRSSEPLLDGEPLSIRVDARLPNPSILTCHQPLPLRILVERMNQNPASISLSNLQIQLIGTTMVRAQDLSRQELTSWILLSMANLNVLLDTSDGKQPNTVVVPSTLWSQKILPSTVIPSFQTCNISRSYTLEVRVGISHGTSAGRRPELIDSTLHFPVQVFSGVAPPQELLNRVNTNSSKTGRSRLSTNGLSRIGTQSTPSTPAYSPSSPAYTFNPTDLPSNSSTDVPPPSYEDAMAEDLPPSDGPRHQFDIALDPSSPSPTPQSPISTGDSKNSDGLTRHPSERLFSSNNPRPPETKHKIKRKAVAQRSNSVFVESSSTSTPSAPISHRHRESTGITPNLHRIAIEDGDGARNEEATGVVSPVTGQNETITPSKEKDKDTPSDPKPG